MNISVIIPVHNSVPFLDKCLSTILPQLRDDDEVLLLENGSTDDSWSLCEQYAAGDRRIRAVTLGPCGVSHARNEGIRLASCNWITFVDSDDFLSPDALSAAHLWSKSEPADILCFDFISVDGNGNAEEIDSAYPASSDQPLKVSPELLVKSSLRYAYHGKEAEAYGFSHVTIWTCWAKFFRKEFLQENNITFPEELVLSEDTFFMIHAFLKANNIFSFPQKIYRYRTNENSASRILHPKQLENNTALRQRMYNLLKSEDRNRIYIDELSVFLTRKLIEEVLYMKESGSFDRKDAHRYIHEVLKKRYMRNALERTGYSKIIAGKKNSLIYGYVLWCLKHKTEMMLFK